MQVKKRAEYIVKIKLTNNDAIKMLDELSSADVALDECPTLSKLWDKMCELGLSRPAKTKNQVQGDLNDD